jgi:hypothetical protein
MLNPADFNELSESEKRHFYKCQHCGEMVDMRQLDDVLFHEDHKPRSTFNTAVLNGLSRSNERTSLADTGRKERTGSSLMRWTAVARKTCGHQKF